MPFKHFDALRLSNCCARRISNEFFDIACMISFLWWIEYGVANDQRTSAFEMTK